MKKINNKLIKHTDSTDKSKNLKKKRPSEHTAINPELNSKLFKITDIKTEATLSSSITPTDIANSKPFSAMLNGTATNQLTNINTRSNPPIVDAITGNATIP